MGLFFSRKKPEPGIEVRGVAFSLTGDWYHAMLRAPWWFALLVIIGTFILLNLLFAFAYLATGGVVGARPDHFSDLFFFSVQTMGTIGYGSMYPANLGAHIIVTSQALIGILLVALSTGIVFAKFSVVRARARFAKAIVITPVDGVPTLMFRIGHQRSSPVIDVTIRVILTRTEHSAEGVLMYRSYDLHLERDHAPALSRTWLIMHRITEQSPLWCASPESCVKDEIELMITLRGSDETSGQLLHARKTYYDGEIRWGSRYADMLSEGPNGVFVVDMNVFDDVLPSKATPTFPYPALLEDGARANQERESAAPAPHAPGEGRRKVV
jgi:inward rectifier potassium channel